MSVNAFIWPVILTFSDIELNRLRGSFYQFKYLA